VAEDAEIVVKGIREICGNFNRLRRKDVLLNAISATPLETISHCFLAGAKDAGGTITLISPPEISASFFWNGKTNPLAGDDRAGAKLLNINFVSALTELPPDQKVAAVKIAKL
jgi:hypothetical protein